MVPFPTSLNIGACWVVLGKVQRTGGAGRYVDWLNTMCSQLLRINNFSLCCPLCNSKYFGGFSSFGSVTWAVYWYSWTTLAINCFLNFSESLMNYITCVPCPPYTLQSQSTPLLNYFFLSLSLCGCDSSFGRRLLRKFLLHQSSFGFWIQSSSKRQLWTFYSSLNLDQNSGVGIR